MRNLTGELHAILKDLGDYIACFNTIRLRPYQIEAAQAVLESVLNGDGETFVWIFARQGGKDETLAALYQYLMVLFSYKDAAIVSASPTYRPQAQAAIQRLDARLSSHLVLKRSWRKVGNTFRIGRARTRFLSAQSHASVVGETAGLLLVINEAQDISPLVYDKRFAPMAAANNATRLFSGTAWTRSTLLAREERLCRLKEEQDGRQRVFRVDGPRIASVHPPYGKFLEGEIARLGIDHPIVVSQYLCREIDAQAGMFNAGRRALMQSDRPPVGAIPVGAIQSAAQRYELPLPGRVYAFCIDVAGQDEAMLQLEGLGNPGRDSTTLSIIEVDLSTMQTLQLPTYRVMRREAWKGLNHLTVFGKIKALADIWKPQHIVIDATGVGEGLWAMLDRTFPTRVTPVKFSQTMKSEIGWGFLAIIETGRFRDCASNDEVRLQYEACQSEILPGPLKNLRWGVPDGTRTPDGQLIHDDYIMADALAATLDKLAWSVRSPTLIVQGVDPLESMDAAF